MLARFHHVIIGLEIAVSGWLLALAWTQPIMTVRTWVFFYEDVSVFDAARRLYEDELLTLAALVFFFAIVFPGIKMLVLSMGWLNLWNGNGGGRLASSLKTFEVLGKWSMLDVFVVAVVVVSTQTSLVSSAELHTSLYYFAGAVLLSMIATMDLRKYLRREGGGSVVAAE
jgi:paraquat-inducible protein A